MIGATCGSLIRTLFQSILTNFEMERGLERGDRRSGPGRNKQILSELVQQLTTLRISFPFFKIVWWKQTLYIKCVVIVWTNLMVVVKNDPYHNSLRSSCGPTLYILPFVCMVPYDFDRLLNSFTGWKGIRLLHQKNVLVVFGYLKCLIRVRWFKWWHCTYESVLNFH